MPDKTNNGATSPLKRARAPTITVDTSALDTAEQNAPEYASPTTVTAGEQNPNHLTIAAARARADSEGSVSSVGSQTFVGSEASHTRSNSTNTTNLIDDAEALKPDPGKEKDFQVENNPFGFSPGQMDKLFPKNYAAFHAVHGLAGLAKGLRTDIQAGLSADEDRFSDKVSFEDAISTATPNRPPDTGQLQKPGGDEPTSNASKPTGMTDRIRVFGDNRLPERKSKTFFQLCWMALQDKILILLSIAAVVSLALGLYQTFDPNHGEGARVEWVEGVAIIVAITIVVVVGALNDWQKERQFIKLNRKKEDREVKVIRSGKTTRISIHDIMAGELMLLEQGDIVPVDGIFINGHNVACDESSATGESDIMRKTAADTVYKAMESHKDLKKLDPFIISGAKVSEGVGTFLVTATGKNSSYGKTLLSLRDEGEVTPLQLKLNVLAGYIAKLGSAAGLLLFVVLFIQFLARLSGNNGTAQQKAQEFLNVLIVAVTIIVVAVPEGLPLAVTLALAFATKRMTKDNNLVRHLQSCETMGNATVICSDKTGTLTQNVMTVVGGCLGVNAVAFSETGITQRLDEESKLLAEKESNLGDSATTSPDSDFSKAEKRLTLADLASNIDEQMTVLLRESVAINSTAFEGEEEGKPAFIGSKTETALLDWAKNYLGMDALSTERANLPAVQLFPFDSRWKCMAAVVKKDDKTYRMFLKGAPEIVLKHCTKIVTEPNHGITSMALEESAISEIKLEISSYANLSLRTIGLSYRDFESWPPKGVKSKSDDPKAVEFDDVRSNLTWIGVVGIQDPVRKGVPEAVKDCNRAGVNVKMVTGDNVETARAIAREIGILEMGGLVMEGPDFRKLTDYERQQTVTKLSVLARSSPEDKQILVRALRSLGNVVAVTGDGTNDAQALKAADVGFSMGIAGTEVAKEASDIILMDDNFSSIVKALAWGRTVNDAVKKFLQFQLTVNVTAVVLTFVTAVASPNERAVLNAVQLLWVNLIMDTFAALALATDPPTSSLLDRKPEPRNRPLINLTMWKMIIGQSIFQLIATFVLYFAGPRFLPYDDIHLSTTVFNAFVWMQIFNAINSRRIDNGLNCFEGIHKNWLFMAILAIMIGGQILIVFVGGAAFVVTSLDGAQWGISLVIGVLSIPIGALIRLFPDRWISASISKIVPKFVLQHYERKRAAQEMPEPGQEGYLYHERMALIRDDLAWFRRFHGGRVAQFDKSKRKIAELKFSMMHPKEVWVETHRRSRSRSEGGASSRSPMRSVIAMSGSMAGSIGVGGIVIPTTPGGSADGGSSVRGHSGDVSRDVSLAASPTASPKKKRVEKKRLAKAGESSDPAGMV